MKCPSFQKRTGRQNEPLQTDEVSVSPVVSSVCYLKALESENRLKQQGDTAIPIGYWLKLTCSDLWERNAGLSLMRSQMVHNGHCCSAGYLQAENITKASLGSECSRQRHDDQGCAVLPMIIPMSWLVKETISLTWFNDSKLYLMLMENTCFHLFDPFSSPWILRYKPSLGLFLSWTHPWHGFFWGASVWVRIWSIPSTCRMRSAGGHQRNPTGFRSQLGYGWPRVLAPILGFHSRLAKRGWPFQVLVSKGTLKKASCPWNIA